MLQTKPVSSNSEKPFLKLLVVVSLNDTQYIPIDVHRIEKYHSSNCFACIAFPLNLTLTVGKHNTGDVTSSSLL